MPRAYETIFVGHFAFSRSETTLTDSTMLGRGGNGGRRGSRSQNQVNKDGGPGKSNDKNLKKTLTSAKKSCDEETEHCAKCNSDFLEEDRSLQCKM